MSFLVRHLAGHGLELAQVLLLPQDLQFRDHLPGLLQLVGGGAQPAFHDLPAHVQPGFQGVQHPLGLGGEGRGGGLDQLDLLGQQVHVQARARAVALLGFVGRLAAVQGAPDHPAQGAVAPRQGRVRPELLGLRGGHPHHLAQVGPTDPTRLGRFGQHGQVFQGLGHAAGLPALAGVHLQTQGQELVEATVAPLTPQVAPLDLQEAAPQEETLLDQGHRGRQGRGQEFLVWQALDLRVTGGRLGFHEFLRAGFEAIRAKCLGRRKRTGDAHGIPLPFGSLAAGWAAPVAAIHIIADELENQHRTACKIFIQESIVAWDIREVTPASSRRARR